MLLKRILIGVPLLLFAICCAVKGIPVIEGPSEVIFRPGEGPVELTCVRNTTAGSVLWRVNGSNAMFAGDFPGHTAAAGGISLVVVNATNNTRYICVSFVQSMVEMPQTDSEPVYLYIAAAPAMITNVIIDLDTVNIDNDNVSFTLNWNEPFANFDPIVNYTVTINCTDNATCPVIVNTDNVTRTANVNFITDLSMMTTLSVTATNTIGTSDAAIRIITVPGDVDITGVACIPVNLINQCTVTWNPIMFGDNTVAAPVSYNVSYFGEGIKNGSVIEADGGMTTFDLPAVDSDVNVFVTAMNVFGTGEDSDILVNEIMAPSVTEAMPTLVTPNENRTEHSIIVTCTVRPESNATVCVVMATFNSTTTITNMSAINDNGMATVTVDGLVCNITYNITAGGTLNGALVGPRSSHGTVTSGPCPLPMPTPSVETPSMSATTSPMTEPTPLPTTGGSTSDDDPNTGAIVGGVVGGILGAILVILIILLICYCYHKSKTGEGKFNRATSPEKGATGVKVHTLDRYGKPIPLEGENTDTGTELTGFPAKSPEFTVSQVPATTFQGNDYQTEEKNRTPSAFVPEGSYDTLAPADEPTAPSAEVVPPAQNGQSNPNAPKLNYADLEQFTRKPASVKKPEPQPASQYAVIDPKSLQQGTYT